MTVKAQIKWTDERQFIARAGNGPAVVLDSSEGGNQILRGHGLVKRRHQNNLPDC